MKEENIVLLSLFFAAVIIAIVCFIFIWTIAGGPELKTCKDNGYNTYVNQDDIEHGYIKCCNIIYENHQESDRECKIFKISILGRVT